MGICSSTAAATKHVAVKDTDGPVRKASGRGFHQNSSLSSGKSGRGAVEQSPSSTLQQPPRRKMMDFTESSTTMEDMTDFSQRGGGNENDDPFLFSPQSDVSFAFTETTALSTPSPANARRMDFGTLLQDHDNNRDTSPQHRSPSSSSSSRGSLSPDSLRRLQLSPSAPQQPTNSYLAHHPHLSNGHVSPSTSSPSGRKMQAKLSSSRALQHRLEKARNMQKVLLSNNSSGASVASSMTGASSYLDSSSHILPSDSMSVSSAGTGHSGSRRTGNSLRRSSPSSRGTVADQQQPRVNNRHDAAANSVWAELEQTDAVLALALSSKRKPTMNMATPPLYLAVGTADGKVTVTEILDEAPQTTSLASFRLNKSHQRLGPSLFLHRQSRIRCLDFSGDGRYLAVAGDDCVCAVYELDYREIPNVNQDDDDDETSEKLVDLLLVAEIPRVDRVMTCRFDPGSKYLAVGGYDGTVMIWSMEPMSTYGEGRLDLVTEIVRHGSLILTMDWSPDGQCLAIGGSEKVCAVMDTRSWKVIKEVRRPAVIQAVQWHPSGRYLAMASNNVAIYAADHLLIQTEVELKDVPMRIIGGGGSPNNRRGAGSGGASSRVGALCWSPNGSYLVASGQHKCFLLETRTYKVLQEVARDSATIHSMVWAQQDAIAGVPRRYLVLGGDDQKAVILKAGLELGGSNLSVMNNSVADDLSSAASSYFSARGNWVMKDNMFRDVDEGGGARTSMMPKRPPNRVQEGENKNRSYDGTGVIALTFSQGSKSRSSAFFCVATDDGFVTIRSTLDWKILAQLEFPCLIRSLAFSYGSRYLVLGSEDGKVRIVATVPLWKVATEVDFESPIASMRFSKNNERLVVGCRDGLLAFLHPGRGWESAGVVEQSDSPIISLDWNSKHLGIGRQDGTVRIYTTGDILDGIYSPCQAMLRCKSPALALAFGGSSRFIVVGDNAGILNIYSAKGGWALCHEIRTDASISAVSWSPQGRYLAFGNTQTPFRVLDTIFWSEVDEANDLCLRPADGIELVSFTPTICFSQDGKRIGYTDLSGGTHVADTTSWEVKFSLHPAAAPNANADLDMIDESSLSSQDHDENDMHDDLGLLSD